MGSITKSNSGSGKSDSDMTTRQRDSYLAENALSEIDTIENLSRHERRKLKKQIVKQFYNAREREIEQRLDLFQATLRSKKDTELKRIAVEAQKTLLSLEKEHSELMSELGITAHEEISDMLIKLGEVTTRNLDQVRKAGIDDDLKADVVGGIKKSFGKAYKRIMDGVDAYMEELKDKPSRR